MRKKQKKELAEQINEILEKMANDLKKHLEEGLEEAKLEDVKIIAESKNGKQSVSVEGSRRAVLMMLVGLEKNIFDTLQVCDEEFDFYKQLIGIEIIETKQKPSKKDKK